MFNVDVLCRRDNLTAVEQECARIRTVVSADTAALHSLALRDPTTPWILPALLDLLRGSLSTPQTQVDVLAVLTLMAETAPELANALSEACALPLLVDIVSDDARPTAIALQAAVCMGALAHGSPTFCEYFNVFGGMRAVLARLSDAPHDECVLLLPVVLRLIHRDSADLACARRVCAALLQCEDAAVGVLNGALEVIAATPPVAEIDACALPRMVQLLAHRESALVRLTAVVALSDVSLFAGGRVFELGAADALGALLDSRDWRARRAVLIVLLRFMGQLEDDALVRRAVALAQSDASGRVRSHAGAVVCRFVRCASAARVERLFHSSALLPALVGELRSTKSSERDVALISIERIIEYDGVIDAVFADVEAAASHSWAAASLMLAIDRIKRRNALQL